MIFKRNLKNLIPYFAAHLIVYGLLGLLLVFVYLKINPNPGQSGIILIIGAVVGVFFGSVIISIARIRFAVMNINFKGCEIFDDALRIVNKDGSANDIAWESIDRVSFNLGSLMHGTGFIEYFGGRKFGYYTIETSEGIKWHIPPAVENQEELLIQIIQRARLKKVLDQNPVQFLANAITFYHWIKSDEQQTEEDFNLCPRRQSKIGQWIIASVIILMALIILQTVGAYYGSGQDYIWNWF